MIEILRLGEESGLNHWRRHVKSLRGKILERTEHLLDVLRHIENFEACVDFLVENRPMTTWKALG